jgi:hypothetical protein
MEYNRCCGSQREARPAIGQRVSTVWRNAAKRPVLALSVENPMLSGTTFYRSQCPRTEHNVKKARSHPLPKSGCEPLASFPIYLLRCDGQWNVVFPQDRSDIGHTEFWEQSVSQIVANYYGIPAIKLANLPYCQRRARIVGNKVFYGEDHNCKLLQVVRKTFANKKLVFDYDDHEKRLPLDVLGFRRLVRRYSRK